MSRLTPYSPPALDPEIARLVDAGLLERAELADDGHFESLARGATRLGVVTPGQAAALARLLGLRRRPANDR